MKHSTALRTRAAGLVALLLTSTFAALCVAGCGSKEETTPPANSGYYTGPLKPKQAPGTGTQTPKAAGAKSDL